MLILGFGLIEAVLMRWLLKSTVNQDDGLSCFIAVTTRRDGAMRRFPPRGIIPALSWP